jgi:Domain of unknown function (DUF4184)
MAPDLGYAVSSYAKADTHEGWGILALSVPIGIVFTILVRLAATTIAAQLPDLGGFRVWSWRALSTRWHRWWITGYSLGIGLATHLILDGLTHQRRWGPSLFSYADLELTLLGRRMGVASWLQYLGHSAGTVITLILVWRIGSRHVLDQWYTAEVVSRARSFQLNRRSRIGFWAIVGCGFIAGTLWGWSGDRVEQFTRPMVAVALASTVAHCIKHLRAIDQT